MRGPRTLVTLLALAILVASCGDAAEDEPTDTDTAAEEASIDISGFAFSGPAEVAVGSTVTVENHDTVQHTWTSTEGVFNSGALSQGETFEYTLDEPGEFEFFCSIHPAEMTGVITVTG